MNIADLSILLANFDKTGMTWAQGDFNGDGTVNIADLSMLLANFDKTAGWPPPASRRCRSRARLLLSAVGWLGFVACVWRRGKRCT